MEILDIKVLRGPNYWSISRHFLIELKIDLKEYEDLPTNKLPSFNEKLKQLIPSLFNHFCSPGREGGFFERLDKGTWLGHVIEHIALELQWLAGMQCTFGSTRSAENKGIYFVVFAYEIEKAGIYAAKTAVNIVKSLAEKNNYPSLEKDLEKLKNVLAQEGLGISTTSIVEEARNRNIPFKRLNNQSLVMLGHGCNQKLICSTTSSETTNIGVDIAADKELTKQILSSAYIPTPRGYLLDSLQELDSIMEELGMPLVIKPKDSNHGKGVTTNIRSKEKALFAFTYAKKFSREIIIEKFIEGTDYRLLVVNYKLVAAAKRTPPFIIGNGILTIQELIDELNEDPNRGHDHEKILTTVKIDEVTESLLYEQNLRLDIILPTGKMVYLKSAANISSGGTCEDVTHLVHPHNKFLVERVARLMKLDICGIDVIIDDISTPMTEENGSIIEVNAGPGLRMHLAPGKGQKRNVAKPIVDMLYPENTSSRIPLVAVTGTNGKTTIVRLIAHFAKKAGFHVGMTTTEGVYIDKEEIIAGDCSGPYSAEMVLRDPLVNFAVLECARGGILRNGLGFDHCSIGIVSNISEDHLGLEDIYTLEQLAKVKSVVPESALPSGYAILNADDDLVYAMKDQLKSQYTLFSMNGQNPRIIEHTSGGGLAAYVENGFIIIHEGEDKKILMNIKDVPLSFAGASESMIKNILPAALAGILSGFTMDNIAEWLQDFYPNSENLPGRMNLFHFEDFHVLIDYAHNEGAFLELKKFFDQSKATKKIGIIAATGDRRDIDIQNVGYYAAEIFDEIIIRHDKDGRGRTNDQLTHLMKEGIKRSNKKVKVKIISDEFDAIQHVMENAEKGSLIMYFPEKVTRAIKFIKTCKFKSKEIISKD
jgi:cyanophycin synthetase